jgi:hypothetical protein
VALTSPPVESIHLDVDPPPPCAGLVARLTEHRGRTWVDVLADDGITSVEVPASADTTAAARVRAVFRHVTSVRIEIDGGGISVLVRGIGHRQPVERAVSLRAGLALARQGVPTLLVRSA